jgi:ubiquinone/menaquinone biosynthesis C-methylase UbiE
MNKAAPSIEHRTGALFSDLWHRYDDQLFKESVHLFECRWQLNDERPDYFQGKRCLDAGCGGGRISLAMALMGARSVVGVDVGVEGLEDARRRAEALGLDGVEFRSASVLELPFSDGEFDFVMCNGVLHHTREVERGLRECFRATRPGGEVFLLLYGSGGLYWPLNLVMRSYAGVLGKEEVDRCCEAAGLAANKRRTVLDDLFVPILETYPRERVEALLHSAGFSQWRYWGTGQLDHESDPSVLAEELAIRTRLWEAGAKSASDPVAARVEQSLADLCRVVVSSAHDLIEQHRNGRISASTLRAAVIGSGHHRLIATRP